MTSAALLPAGTAVEVGHLRLIRVVSMFEAYGRTDLTAQWWLARSQGWGMDGGDVQAHLDAGTAHVLDISEAS